MALKKVVNGVEIECTPEEEQEIRNEWESNRLKQLEDEALYGYKYKRKSEYPSIEDQLDMLYKDQVDGTTKWKEEIARVKNLYPKPKL